MKKLKYDKKKKEYSGVAFVIQPPYMDAEFMVMGPNMRDIKKFYELWAATNSTPNSAPN